LAGIALGIWALLSMRFGNLNITPEVKPKAQFVRRGPYKHIRHPMYAALLLASLALVADTYSFLRLAVWLVLLLDIAVKLTYEEHLLDQAFAEYSVYRRETKRLIPFIF
jgi:protein-S-isoprenylcysteine O-methyltransferase Ste14